MGSLTGNPSQTFDLIDMTARFSRNWRSFICILFLALCAPVYGDTTADLNQAGRAADAGIVAGTVTDSELGTRVRGAVIEFDDTEWMAVSDVNGRFTIRGVAAGLYDVTISHRNFQPARIRGVVVVSGDVVNLDLGLHPRSSSLEELDAFEFTFEDVQTGEMKLLGDRQRSASVSDAIGEEAFSRLGLGDAAQAMSKVTGATVVDGKYVIIRGLGDRYSNTLLNGAAVPSADPDRRAVQLDQFPAEVLESIVTTKSFTPDQPGDFSGGSVNLRTKNFPERFFVKMGMGMGYHENATGKNVMTIPGGGRDWLAMDDGTRRRPELPDVIPAEVTARIAAGQGNFGPAEELDRITRLFHNPTYFPARKKGDYPFNFDFSLGDQIVLSQRASLGYIGSFTYGRGVRHSTEGTSARYSQGSSDLTDPRFVDPRVIYSPDLNLLGWGERVRAEGVGIVLNQPLELGVTRTAWEVSWGAFGQLALKLGADHEFVLRFFHNQSADDVIRRGVGEATRSDGGRFWEIYDFLYTERGTSSLQLEGQHAFARLGDLQVAWRASLARSTQDQPDFRQISYFYDFDFQQFASAAGVGNNRIFRELDDRNFDLGLDLTLPLERWGLRGSFLKAGLAYLDGEREYEEFAYRWSQSIRDLRSLQEWPGQVGIVARTDNSVTFGNTLRNITGSLADYRADKTISAGYLMMDWAIVDRWRAIFGVRAEKSEITTGRLRQSTAAFRSGEIDQTDWLPAASVVYTVRDNMNVRAAYGRTLARPEYRELANIRVQNPFNDEFYTGNPELQITLIDNYDLRWEWFPRPGELVAASMFYKSMRNPIEVAAIPRIGSISPQNVDRGKVYGVELEYRQDLDLYWEPLRFFSLGANLSLMDSEISIPEGELATIRSFDPQADDTRELLEQSPYIINLDLTYNQYERGTRATLAFNVFGDRLALVQDGVLPDIMERSSPQLDFIFSQEIRSRWSFKFTARNLLGSDREKSFDDFSGNRFLYERSEPGRSFSVGLSYTFR